MPMASVPATWSRSAAGTLYLPLSSSFTGSASINARAINLSNSTSLANNTVNLNGGSLIFDQSVTESAFYLGGLGGFSNLALQTNAGTPGAIYLSVGGNNGNTILFGRAERLRALTMVGTRIADPHRIEHVYRGDGHHRRHGAVGHRGN